MPLPLPWPGRVRTSTASPDKGLRSVSLFHQFQKFLADLFHRLGAGGEGLQLVKQKTRQFNALFAGLGLVIEQFVPRGYQASVVEPDRFDIAAAHGVVETRSGAQICIDYVAECAQCSKVQGETSSRAAPQCGNVPKKLPDFKTPSYRQWCIIGAMVIHVNRSLRSRIGSVLDLLANCFLDAIARPMSGVVRGQNGAGTA